MRAVEGVGAGFDILVSVGGHLKYLILIQSNPRGLAGFYLIDCPSPEEAVAWAAKVPDARYTEVEVARCWT